MDDLEVDYEPDEEERVEEKEAQAPSRNAREGNLGAAEDEEDKGRSERERRPAASESVQVHQKSV